MAQLVLVVRRALTWVALTPADEAAAELAVTYAEMVDSGIEPLTKVGPALLSCLESLGMTPKSRKAVVEAVKDAGISPLDEIRAKRAARTAG
jgi:hypothetical protein